MDADEIARRELERLEKKKRKQERRLLKSQNKLLHGDLFHTPGSDSDSGVSHVTDSEQSTGQHFASEERNQTQSSCDQTPHTLQNQRHLNQDAAVSELDSSDSSQQSSFGASNRGSNLQKLNPFSVESLLSDSRPRRKPNLDAFPALPSSRPLMGKGHFLLYPITQPLGFIVPQTALKTVAPNSDTDSSIQRSPANDRSFSASTGCKNSMNSSDSPQNDALSTKGQVGSEKRPSSQQSSPDLATLSNGKCGQTSFSCSDTCFPDDSPDLRPIDSKSLQSDRREQLEKDYPENSESVTTNSPPEINTDSKDVDME